MVLLQLEKYQNICVSLIGNSHKAEYVDNPLVVVVQIVAEHRPPALPDKVAVAEAQGDLLGKVDLLAVEHRGLLDVKDFSTLVALKLDQPHFGAHLLQSCVQLGKSGPACFRQCGGVLFCHIFAPRVWEAFLRYELACVHA